MRDRRCGEDRAGKLRVVANTGKWPDDTPSEHFALLQRPPRLTGTLDVTPIQFVRIHFGGVAGQKNADSISLLWIRGSRERCVSRARDDYREPNGPASFAGTAAGAASRPTTLRPIHLQKCSIGARRVEPPRTPERSPAVVRANTQ